MIREAIDRLLAGQSLSAEEAEDVMDEVMGERPPRRR